MDKRPADDPAVDALLDLFVYAPLGLAMELSARFPDYAARGRSTVESQVGTARFIGEFAVQQGTRQLRRWVERTRAPQSEAAEPVGEPTPPVVTTADIIASDSAMPTEADHTVVTVVTGDLPLADYDSLAAAQILPLLVGLTAQELDAVRRYELAHRARMTVLGKIEQLSSP